MEITPKDFNDFQIKVFNRLEELHDEVGSVKEHVIQTKAVLFGTNGDPGKLCIIDKRLDAHTRQITRLMQIVWPLLGVAALLVWLGVESVQKVMK